ncbi:MAG: thiamine-phosphate kinase [Polyangiaceae bacterium]|nr:thiamine-phosphate kinase [Polyangiaceae bacterium]
MIGVNEEQAIAILTAYLSPKKGRQVGVELGIGDDAAILKTPGISQVISVDAAIEGVHYRRPWLSPDELAGRAFHAAASDLAAMGARPTAALTQITLPRDISRSQFQRLAQGQAFAAAELACPIVGGNITGGRSLDIVTTVVGQPWTKQGALLRRTSLRAGDELWLIGCVGLARAGLFLLQKDSLVDERPQTFRRINSKVGAASEKKAALEKLLRESRLSKKRRLSALRQLALLSFRCPQALVRSGRSLVGRARAAMDVSDGLAKDLHHLGRGSDCCVVVDATSLRRAAAPSAFADLCEAEGWEFDDMILQGGEDFCLLASGPRSRRPRGAQVIGHIEKGRGVQWNDAGQASALPLGGFHHVSF